MALLSLPQELRDCILLYALITRNEPTVDFDNTTRSQFQEPDDLNHRARFSSKGVYYSLRPTNTALSLLQTNRQLQNETKTILERYHKRHGNHYKLDIILLDEEDLACSWAQVPPMRREVDSLEVTFRIQGVSGRKNGFMDRDGSTGSSVWRLYGVVERFLRCGAIPPKTRSCDRGLQVKELKIKVLMPDLKHPKKIGCVIAHPAVSPDRIPQYRHNHRDKKPVMLHPEALARFMFIWIEGLMRMSDPTYAFPGAPVRKYGGIFIERLGIVKLSSEGGQEYEAFPKEYAGRPNTPPANERGIVEHVGKFEG
jgi:hypothetical protein